MGGFVHGLKTQYMSVETYISGSKFISVKEATSKCVVVSSLAIEFSAKPLTEHDKQLFLCCSVDIYWPYALPFCWNIVQPSLSYSLIFPDYAESLIWMYDLKTNSDFFMTNCSHYITLHNNFEPYIFLIFISCEFGVYPIVTMLWTICPEFYYNHRFDGKIDNYLRNS